MLEPSVRNRKRFNMNTEKIRKDFPILEKKFDGKKITYLDNAATSLKPIQVIEKIDYYYKECNANIHRGVHRMSEEASQLYEEAHSKTAKFINARNEKEIIFTRNATESMNLLMYSFYTSDFFKHGDEILISKMEHHANIVPWQFLEKKGLIKLNYVELNKDFTLNLEDLENKLNSKTKIVSLTQASNTVASINPIQEIGKIVKDNNSTFIVDGAQSTPHFPVDMKKLNCDFFAFSSHKMLGPTGMGVLYGKQELLEEMNPFLFGGDMISEVSLHESKWNALPYKFEAGTPHISGGIAFSEALNYLQKLGMKEIHEHEKKLIKFALEKFSELDYVNVYCPKNEEKQGGIILFNSPLLEPHELALALDEKANIAIRSGMHCAEPMISSITKKGLDRASFYLYTTKEEIEFLTENLKEVLAVFK